MVNEPDVQARILTDALLHNRSYQALGQLCDTIGGRVAGTENGRKAEEFVAEFFRQAGLEPWFEAFPVTAWERGPLSVVALGPSSWEVCALAHGNCPAQAQVEADVIDLGYGENEDFERLKDQVAGKLALCTEGVRDGHRALHRSEKLAFAVDFGAAGLMILSSAPGNLPRTGMCADKPAKIPSLGISLEDGQRMLRMLNQGVAVRVRIEMQNRLSESEARNVIAEIRGSAQPNEVVLAGGHLDSWDPAQGAADNGLGSAIVMDMARVLNGLPTQPKRTMRFALWAAEEIGLCGSWDYVRKHEADLDNLHAVMNFDMTGTPFGYWLPGQENAPQLISELADDLSGIGMTTAFSGTPGLHSDHQPFMLSGVQAIGLQARLEGGGGHYYHAVGDTFDKIDKPGLCKAVAVGASTMWTVANSPTRLFPRRPHAEVVEMVKKADLLEALAVEGWYP